VADILFSLSGQSGNHGLMIDESVENENVDRDTQDSDDNANDVNKDEIYDENDIDILDDSDDKRVEDNRNDYIYITFILINPLLIYFTTYVYIIFLFEFIMYMLFRD